MTEFDLDAFDEIEPLGSGGLGDVYRAVRRSTGGPVAIKVLRDWTDHDAAWQRTQRELRALVDLRGHANVVNVEEVIETDGAMAIVMEYAPGGSVHDLLARRDGRLEMAETLLVATHTAAALAAAHSRGIIHRDIKPHNLLIGSFGQVKVCDFGIASLTRSESVRDRTSSLSLRYASPEELRGDQEVSTASDIYSLAATIHQLLTGQYLPLPDGRAGSIPLRTWVAPDDVPADVELDFRSLVVQSADRRPDARPAAAELHDRFEELAGRLGAGRVRALPLVAALGDDATTPGTEPTGPTSAPSSVGTAGPVGLGAAAGVAAGSSTAGGGGGTSSGDGPPAEPPGETVMRPGPDPAATVVGAAGASAALAGATAAYTPTAGGPPGGPPPAPPGAGGASGGGGDGRSSGRTALLIFSVLAVVLVAAIAAFGFGWLGGGGDDDASAATTVESTSTTIASDATTVAAPTTSDVSTTGAPPTTAEPIAPTTVPDPVETTSTTTDAVTTTEPAPTTTVPEGYDRRKCPGIGACIELQWIGVENGEYRIRWNASFTPDLAGDHAHFFWDVYEPDQVGSASADRAPWELTADFPIFVPSGEMRRADRPDGANGICVTAADVDHAVIDPSFFHCAWIPPVAEELAQEAIDGGADLVELWPELLD